MFESSWEWETNNYKPDQGDRRPESAVRLTRGQWGHDCFVPLCQCDEDRDWCVLPRPPFLYWKENSKEIPRYGWNTSTKPPTFSISFKKKSLLSHPDIWWLSLPLEGHGKKSEDRYADGEAGGKGVEAASFQLYNFSNFEFQCFKSFICHLFRFSKPWL